MQYTYIFVFPDVYKLLNHHSIYIYVHICVHSVPTCPKQVLTKHIYLLHYGTACLPYSLFILSLLYTSLPQYYIRARFSGSGYAGYCSPQGNSQVIRFWVKLLL